MNLNIVLIGLGQVGMHLAKVLSQEDHDIIGVEVNPPQCRDADECLDIKVLQGCGTDHAVLEAAGIAEADMLIAVTGSDEQNVLACSMAARYGVKQKIARIRNPAYFDNPPLFQLSDWGVDVAIQPELETAKEIVLLIKRSAASDVLEFAENRIQVIGIRIDAACPVKHMTLEKVSREYPDKVFRTVAILRNNKTIIPSGNDLYLPRDQVFIIAAAGDIPDVISLMGKSEEKLQKIMILGGGRVGRNTARFLEEEDDLKVKLIESDPEQAVRLADELKRTLVIQGDGRDFNLLATEDILEMDALIAATNDEETNILTSLLAKHLGVAKTIALVNRREYLPLMAPIGVNAAVNTNVITSNTILRLIRRGDVVSMANLSGVDAQVVEYLAHDDARITRKPLSRISFPDGAIVGAVTRGNDVFVPFGDTRIQNDDHVVVFALPQALQHIDKLFSS